MKDEIINISNAPQPEIPHIISRLESSVAFLAIPQSMIQDIIETIDIKRLSLSFLGRLG
jgi:hypothetical protein